MFVNRFKNSYNRNMIDAEAARIARAASAGEEHIFTLLHDPSPQVIRSLLGNRNLTDNDVLVIVNRKNLPPDIFAAIAQDRRWSESYPIRLALAKNPKTPLSVSLSIVRYLRLFDIAEMTRSQFLPLAFRRKIESIVIERIPTMPLGQKKSLAKTAAGAILVKLLRDADEEVVTLCLNNPHLQENHLFKILTRKDTFAPTIRMIANHRNWSNRSLIRYSLVRNEHTPLALSGRFLQTMSIGKLRELYADSSIPASTRPLVYRELLNRGQEPREKVEDQEFEVDENDDAGLEDFEAGIDEQEGKTGDG